MDFQKCKKKIQSCSETEVAQLSNLVTLLSKCSGKVTEREIQEIITTKFFFQPVFTFSKQKQKSHKAMY